MGYASGGAVVGGEDDDEDDDAGSPVVAVAVVIAVVVAADPIPPSITRGAKNTTITKWISITTTEAGPKLSISAIWLSILSASS